MKAKAPYFPFYAGDWLSSSTIELMTVEQEGAYVRLLAHCWLSGDCTLPDDDAALAKLSRLGDRWESSRAAIRACFVKHPTKTGRIFNARLAEEWKKYTKYCKSQRTRALHRWSGNAMAMPRQCHGNASVALPRLCQSESESQSESKEGEERAPVAAALPPPDAPTERLFRLAIDQKIIAKPDTLRRYIEGWHRAKGYQYTERVLSSPGAAGRDVLFVNDAYFSERRNGKTQPPKAPKKPKPDCGKCGGTGRRKNPNTGLGMDCACLS